MLDEATSSTADAVACTSMSESHGQWLPATPSGGPPTIPAPGRDVSTLQSGTTLPPAHPEDPSRNVPQSPHQTETTLVQPLSGQSSKKADPNDNETNDKVDEDKNVHQKPEDPLVNPLKFFITEAVYDIESLTQSLQPLLAQYETEVATLVKSHKQTSEAISLIDKMVCLFCPTVQESATSREDTLLLQSKQTMKTNPVVALLTKVLKIAHPLIFISMDVALLAEGSKWKQAELEAESKIVQSATDRMKEASENNSKLLSAEKALDDMKTKNAVLHKDLKFAKRLAKEQAKELAKEEEDEVKVIATLDQPEAVAKLKSELATRIREAEIEKEEMKASHERNIEHHRKEWDLNQSSLQKQFELNTTALQAKFKASENASQENYCLLAFQNQSNEERIVDLQKQIVKLRKSNTDILTKSRNGIYPLLENTAGPLRNLKLRSEEELKEAHNVLQIPATTAAPTLKPVPPTEVTELKIKLEPVDQVFTIEDQDTPQGEVPPLSSSTASTEKKETSSVSSRTPPSRPSSQAASYVETDEEDSNTSKRAPPHIEDRESKRSRKSSSVKSDRRAVFTYETQRDVLRDIERITSLFRPAQEKIYRTGTMLIKNLRDQTISDENKMNEVYAKLSPLHKRRTPREFLAFLTNPAAAPHREEAWAPLPNLFNTSPEWLFVKSTNVKQHYSFANWTMLIRVHDTRLYNILTSASRLGLRNEANVLMKPTSMKERPMIEGISQKKDITETKVDLLLLLLCSRIAFGEFKMTSNCAPWPIYMEERAFSTAWASRMIQLRQHDEMRLSTNDIYRLFIDNGSLQAATSELRRHEARPHDNRHPIHQQPRDKNLHQINQDTSLDALWKR